jgi:hypothetical protein
MPLAKPLVDTLTDVVLEHPAITIWQKPKF